MKINPKVTLERVMAAVEEDESIGFCLACGEEAYGVEPDARNYQCESCGEKCVCGAEDILLILA